MSVVIGDADSRKVRMMAEYTHKVPYGHTFHRIGRQWFLTDDSREQYNEIDQSKSLRILTTTDPRWYETVRVPLVGDESTIASTAEALWIATHIGMSIVDPDAYEYVVTQA